MQLKRLAKPAEAFAAAGFSCDEPVFSNVRPWRRKTRRAMSTIPQECRGSPVRRARPWSADGCEPHLEDVLADPIVHQVMRRDGVEPAQLRALIAVVRARQRGKPRDCLCAA
jgi:hypothetical protein